ncbi:hypothetical protein [Parapedobacter tibetensis]|uniref:hypothetical protein n=1 Tax=Parapedobacter tibetensis TaxID=2972951 RepID=UPI00214D540E|nr:hypothetical protein [Parapedobacter tibetensis]
MLKPPRYLKAGALLLALMLTVIIAVVTAGLLLLLQYHRQYGAQTLRQERLQQHLASGISLLLTHEGDLDQDTVSLSLYNTTQDSVILTKHAWGIYDVGSVQAVEGRDTLGKWFLFGLVPDKTERYALYLADEHRPLSLSGHTRIQGDAFLPEAGIRKAYIENQAYEGEEVVSGGTSYTSNPDLPALNSAIIDRLTAYLYPDEDETWAGMTIDDFPAYGPNPIYRAFAEQPLLLLYEDSLVIDAHILKGHVLVLAKGPVTIMPSAQLEDILVFAPSITFVDGFSGRLQVFARDSISVGKNCSFGYPSALGLINIPVDSTFSEFQPLLRVDSASTVNGIVFTHFPGDEELLLAKIQLGKETTVHGQVYADGLLELRGTVQGMTSCRRFTLQTPSSLYENFVLNGVMDYSRLSPHYVGSPLLNGGRRGAVMKWLNTPLPPSRGDKQGGE